MRYHRGYIKNTKDGACVRYLNMRQEFSRKTYYLFIQGDSSKNIKNGDFSDDKISKDIVNITTGKDNIKSYKFINESNLFSNFVLIFWVQDVINAMLNPVAVWSVIFASGISNGIPIIISWWYP